MPLYFDFQPRGGNFYLKTWLFISEVQTWSSSVCYWHYHFLKSMRHLLKINNNKTLKKNLRSGDSEGLKLDDFWIFPEISKCEQLYLLFASIKTSVFMLVWKSSGCSLRKYIVLCTHIIIIECYCFSKIEKNSKNSYFIILFHFQHPHTVSKPYWYVLKIAFHIVSQVCFMFSHETLEQAHSVTRSHKDLNFEKSSENPQV